MKLKGEQLAIDKEAFKEEGELAKDIKKNDSAKQPTTKAPSPLKAYVPLFIFLKGCINR